MSDGDLNYCTMDDCLAPRVNEEFCEYHLRHTEHQRLKDAVVAAAKDFSEQGGYCDWDIESVEAQRALLNAVEALLKFERENNL